MRRSIIRSAWLLGALGVLFIWQLSLAVFQLSLASAFWLATVAWQLRCLRRGWRQYEAIRVTPGPTFEVRDAAGDWTPATLGPGSVVFSRFAWIRLETSCETRWAELLISSHPRCNNWRRLQVIWRHIGAT